MSNRRFMWRIALCAAFFLNASLDAQEIPEAAKQIPGYPALFRDGNSVYVKISDGMVTFPFKVPQFAAPLKNVIWMGAPEVAVEIKPEVGHWLVQLAKPSIAPEKGVIHIEFDEVEARLVGELLPLNQNADGSIWLPAHLAKTTGKKLRYEPQANKNTLGYWVEPEDRATWQFLVARPGKFNVAILQGCGVGQGGSTAVLAINIIEGQPNSQAQHSRPETQIEFEVLETGHFQNFQWRHLSEMRLDQPGRYELSVVPKAIRRAALMDIRAIQLIQVPDVK